MHGAHMKIPQNYRELAPPPPVLSFWQSVLLFVQEFGL